MLLAEDNKIMEYPKGSITKPAFEAMKFRWEKRVPEYGSKLLQRLNEFRKKNMYCDLVITTNDDTPVAVHKMVLAACGGIFRPTEEDLFRKHCSISPTAEMSLDCPTNGIRSIIKFAYTGNLELTYKNLFPTFLAAIATEMKEIQDICSQIIISKFGWLLNFDGTKSSLPNPEEGDTLLPLKNAFEILHQIISIDIQNFISENICDSLLDEEEAYPCIATVVYRWPNLKSTYISVINCIRKAETFIETKKEELGETSKSLISQSKALNKAHQTYTVCVENEDKSAITSPLKTTGTSEANYKEDTNAAQVEIKDQPTQRRNQNSTLMVSLSNPVTTSSLKKPSPLKPPAPQKKPAYIKPSVVSPNPLAATSANSSKLPPNATPQQDKSSSPKSELNIPPPRPKPPVFLKKTTKKDESSHKPHHLWKASGFLEKQE